MYKRLVVSKWDADSISQTDDAIYEVTGLARELTELAHPGYENEYQGEWYFPAELEDQWAWLDFAMERIEKLGHKIEWTDGKFVLTLLGGPEAGKNGVFFPFLLGYRSADYLRTHHNRT